MKRKRKSVDKKIKKLIGKGKKFNGKKMYPMAATRPYGFPFIPMITGLASLIGAGASAAAGVKKAHDAFKQPAKVTSRYIRG